MLKQKQEKKIFFEFILALSLIAGTFSLFSVTFGSQQITKKNQHEKSQFFKNERGRKIFPAFFEQEKEERQGKYILHHKEKLRKIQAKSFLVADLDTGEIILERKKNQAYPIASITKYVTAITALSYLKANEVITINNEALQVLGNRAHFRKGDKLTVRELLYPLLLVSSNDAAESLARQRDRMWFIQRMNKLAKQIGMKNANFDDPTGLSIYNKASAFGLFKLMQYVKEKYPNIIKISSLKTADVKNYHWNNINKAQYLPEFRGGKTGYTNAAQQTSIGYYQIKLANGIVRNIAIIILQSNTRLSDTQSILNYLKQYVSYINE